MMCQLLLIDPFAKLVYSGAAALPLPMGEVSKIYDF